MNIVPDILLVAAILGYCVWVILRMRKNKGGCGCGCSGCAMAGACAKKKEQSGK